MHRALQPHPNAAGTAVSGIDVQVSRVKNSLSVRYSIRGFLDRVRIPEFAAPHRADELWEHTCCELFVADGTGPAYREFNFSPSGSWGAYIFDRYREQAAVEYSGAEPRVAVRRHSGALDLEASVTMDPGPHPPLKLAVSAVIEETDGTLSYWALKHSGDKPDFHHPASFAIELKDNSLS